VAREPVIPGKRADIRERSALIGMHLLRTLLVEAWRLTAPKRLAATYSA